MSSNRSNVAVINNIKIITEETAAVSSLQHVRCVCVCVCLGFALGVLCRRGGNVFGCVGKNGSTREEYMLNSRQQLRVLERRSCYSIKTFASSV